MKNKPTAANAAHDIPHEAALLQRFGPHMFKLFEQAASREVTLVFPDKKSAIYLRQRLHKLRKALFTSKHPLSKLAELVEIALIDGKPGNDAKEFFLICRRRDERFEKTFENAGISIETEIEPHPDEIFFSSLTAKDDPSESESEQDT